MAGLETAKAVVVICTRNRARARTFYRDTLGLMLTVDDEFATTFDVGGTTMRVSTVAGFTPHEHTILGFKVADVESAVIALRERGVAFNTYPQFNQNQLGILTVPGTAVHVAWFSDPDGNVLSVTNV